jgi:hypothetical protein
METEHGRAGSEENTSIAQTRDSPDVAERRRPDERKKKSWWPYPPVSEELGRAQQVFVICSFLVWLVPCVAITVYAIVPSSDGLKTWCVSLVAMSAAFLGGTLLGFLFALPRSEKAAEIEHNSKSYMLVRPNTNLEDVSDWLTKIVVGLTLVQLNKIPGLATNLFSWVGSGLGQGESASVFAGSLIVYSSAAGLMQAWIATRLFIIQWMQAADRRRSDGSNPRETATVVT